MGILLSTNQKALEAPEFPEAVKILQQKFSAVTLAGSGLSAADIDCTGDIDMWIVLGGDGTLNRAVNLLMKCRKKVPIFYYPFGTGNDFARSFGLGQEPFLPLLEKALGNGVRSSSVSVGKCNDAYFINVATGGTFATVTPETSPQLKSLAGHWSYLLHGVGKILDRKSFGVRFNGGPEEPAIGFFVANARYVGGGLQVAPEVDPQDPYLEYLLVPDLPTTELISLGVELQKERPDFSRFPVRHGRARSLQLEFSESVPINLDGEQVFMKRAEFQVFPGALQFADPSLPAGLKLSATA